MESNCVFSGKAGLDDLHDLRQLSEHALKKQGVEDDVCAELILAIDEWVTNVISYAYDGNEGELELRIDVNDNQTCICIRDHGPEFDITSAKAAKIKP